MFGPVYAVTKFVTRACFFSKKIFGNGKAFPKTIFENFHYFVFLNRSAVFNSNKKIRIVYVFHARLKFFFSCSWIKVYLAFCVIFFCWLQSFFFCFFFCKYWLIFIVTDFSKMALPSAVWNQTRPLFSLKVELFEKLSSDQC